MKENTLDPTYGEIVDALLGRIEEFEYDWSLKARSNQLEPPGNWRVWLILAGRGFGKTRTGSETLRLWANSGLYPRIALVGETEHDVRSVMVEGESGILNISPPSCRPELQSSLKRLIWPNGTIAEFFSAQNPESLRGPQFHAAWVDELAKYPDPDSVYDQLNFTLRLGKHPKMIITTTPKPVPFIEKLLEKEYVHTTRGSTFDNKEHLSETFLSHVEELYGGTDLGEQELYGKIVHEERLFKESDFKYGFPEGLTWEGASF